MSGSSSKPSLQLAEALLDVLLLRIQGQPRPSLSGGLSIQVSTLFHPSMPPPPTPLPSSHIGEEHRPAPIQTACTPRKRDQKEQDWQTSDSRRASSSWRRRATLNRQASPRLCPGRTPLCSLPYPPFRLAFSNHARPCSGHIWRVSALARSLCRMSLRRVKSGRRRAKSFQNAAGTSAWYITARIASGVSGST